MKRFSDLIALAGSAFFLLAGLGVAAYPFRLLLQGERPVPWFWLMCLSIGLFSLSFGVAILVLALRSMRRRRAEGDADRGRGERHACVIPALAGRHLLLLGFIAWQWNLFGGFLFSLLLSRPASTFGERAMVAGWLLAGGALLLVFAYTVLSARKSAGSAFHTQFPAGRVGGVLAGRIETRTRLDRAAALRVRLACMAQVPHPKAVGDGTAHAEKTLWQAQARIEPARLTWNGRTTGIPVHFDIPADQLPSGALDGWRPVFWRLVAEAELPGIDYFAAFEVPVAGPGQGFGVSPAPTSGAGASAWRQAGSSKASSQPLFEHRTP